MFGAFFGGVDFAFAGHIQESPPQAVNLNQVLGGFHFKAHTTKQLHTTGLLSLLYPTHPALATAVETRHHIMHDLRVLTSWRVQYYGVLTALSWIPVQGFRVSG